MDVLSTVGTVIRRWKVVVPTLVVTVGAALYLAYKSEPAYSASGTLAIVNDSGGEQAAGAIGTSLLAEAVEDGRIRKRVAASAGSAEYSAESMSDNLLVVTAVATRENEAVRAVATVLEELPSLLASQYDARNIASDERATVELVKRPSGAQSVVGDNGDQLFRAEGSAALVLPATVDPSVPRLSSESTYLLLTAIMRGQPFAKAVAESGYRAQFEVETADMSAEASPLKVTVVGASERDVLSTIDVIRDVADEELDRLPEVVGYPEVDQSSVRMLVSPTEAQSEGRGLLRSLVVVIVLGAVLATGLALLVERWSGVVATLRGADAYDSKVSNQAGQTASATDFSRQMGRRSPIDRGHRGYGRVSRRDSIR